VVTLAAVAGLLAGCAVPFPVYTVSSSNITTIRGADRTVELGAFTGDQNSVSCRLQPITPEGHKTFAEYIRAAFADELVIAGNLTTKPKVPLSARVVYIDVACNSLDSNWTIELEVSLPGQAPFLVKTVRPFEYTFFGAAMVPRAYQAFVPAVQDTVANVLAHPNVCGALAP
jgi:hypothetical protein